MENMRSIISDNIRYYREKLKLSQQSLADIVGFQSHQTISQIEKGQREIKASELYNIAKALHIDTSLLTKSPDKRKENVVIWRKTPVIDKEKEEAQFIQRCRQYSLLERLCKLSTNDKLPKYDVDLLTMTYNQAKHLGSEIREKLALGPCPATCISRVLEDSMNVKIWYSELGNDGSAASSKGDFGSAILINLNEKPWRRNFSYAHELFHLITWDVINDDLLNNSGLNDHVEKLAEVFASTLLLPEESLRNTLSDYVKNNVIEETELIEIARKFDVSTDALIWRMCNMSLISADDAKKLVGDKSFKEIDRKSRIDSYVDTPEIPERFVRLAFLALQNGAISRSKVAEYFGVSLLDLTDFFMGYDLDDTKEYETSINIAGC